MAKRIIKIVIILGILGTAYYYRNSLFNFYQNRVSNYVTPCSQPITYNIGSFDTKFNISQATFLKAISAAAQIWDKAVGKQLFAYASSSTATMPINLVYDSRQQSIDQLKKLNLNIDNTQSSYDQLQKVYNTDKAQLTTQQEYYNTQLQAYNAAVQNFNNSGATNRQEYNQLKATEQTLNQEATNLQQLVSNINALVVTLNQIGGQLNIDVSQYNNGGQNLGEFEEGVFTQNGLDKSISIYEFNNYDALVRVLAHELGHSLGMNHVTDPNAIMYALNQSKNIVPTAADIAELNRVCNIK